MDESYQHMIDEEIRQGVIESLQEAKHIKDKELREQVYNVWALSLAKHGYKRIEDMPAASNEPDSAPLKNSNLADQVQSVARLAVAFTKDMEEHLALPNVEMDKVIAATLCYPLDEPEFQRAMQADKDKLRHSTVGAIAHRVDMAFWSVAEHEGLLEGTETYESSPAKTPLTMWEKDRVEVDETIRQSVVESLPEAAMIENEELRERVYDAWAFSLSKSSFRRIEDIRGSGGPHTPTLKQGTQTDHIRGVCRLAMAIAKEFEQNFGLIDVDMDEVIAGGLCHDVGKPLEFDPGNQRQWQANPRKMGYPPMRHSVYGAYVALAVGLPMEIAHVAGCHSREGQFIQRSTVCAIAHEADYAFWDIAGEAGLLENYRIFTKELRF